MVRREMLRDNLSLFCRCAAEARGVGCGMGFGYCFERCFEVGGYFGVVDCLLVLGVEADGYYWDHAVDGLGFRS